MAQKSGRKAVCIFVNQKNVKPFSMLTAPLVPERITKNAGESERARLFKAKVNENAEYRKGKRTKEEDAVVHAVSFCSPKEK